MENWNTGMLDHSPRRLRVRRVKFRDSNFRIRIFPAQRAQRLGGETSEFLHPQTRQVKARIEQNMQQTLSVILVMSLTILFGCSESLTTTEKGAIIGTGAGASLGAVIGSATGHAGVGAGVGAVVGLVGGALIGDQIQERQKQEQELQQQMATQQAQIDQAEQELQQLKQQVEAR